MVKIYKSAFAERGEAALPLRRDENATSGFPALRQKGRGVAYKKY
jgi:hypothetical protein